MAEVRCPLCGKINPAELEVCQYCQARIKPLIVPDPEGIDEQGDLDWTGAEHDSIELQSSETELPEWLQMIRGEGQEESSQFDMEDESDWSFDEGESLVERLPADESRENTEWLTNLDSEGEASESGAPLDEGIVGIWDSETGEKDELPAWLAEDEEEDQPADTQEEQLPEWLTSLGSKADIDQNDEDSVVLSEEHDMSPASMEAEVELPAWLSSLGEKAGVEVSSEPEDLTESFAPDWLGEEGEGDQIEVPAGMEVGMVDEVFDSAGRESTAEDGLSPEAMLDDVVDEVPGWLRDIDETVQEEDVSSFSSEVGSVDTLEWLGDEEIVLPEITGEEVEFPTGLELETVHPSDYDVREELDSDESLTDWLAEEAKEEPVFESGAVDEEEGLAPAELPSWLASMRPLEAAVPDVTGLKEEEHTVGSGPLAGLRGVLPAEPEIARIKKPSVYSIKLQVSDSQQTNVNLLEELIKGEGRAEPIPEHPAISSQHVLRVSIFLILSIAILWTLFTGSQNTALPELTPSVIDLRNTIDGLANGAPVLLAIEYEPGFSGEMDAASAAVLDHLMIKGSRLTLVSTSVTGPAQAERLIQTVNTNSGHNYQSGEQYINLGYLPGGSTGLLGFAQSPQQVIPYALDGTLVWQEGFLENIHSLADFSVLVVVTENPDTARVWIEQVKPSFGETPLLMILSAQAEPMVRPYYEGNPQQVQGMLVGVYGGGSYESSMPRSNLVRKYWDAFSVGVLVAVVMIALGGVINAATSLTKNRNGTSVGKKS